MEKTIEERLAAAELEHQKAEDRFDAASCEEDWEAATDDMTYWAWVTRTWNNELNGLPAKRGDAGPARSDAMGTNFYWTGDEQSDDVHVHIGKRSAAGAYCWDCGATLCLGGTNDIHTSDATWSKNCPACHRSADGGNISGAAAVELGFTRVGPDKQGITSCSSFTWTMLSHKWKLEKMREEGCLDVCVEDEYGRKYMAGQFLDVILSGVAIEFQHAGEFS